MFCLTGQGGGERCWTSAGVQIADSIMRGARGRWSASIINITWRNRLMSATSRARPDRVAAALRVTDRYIS